MPNSSGDFGKSLDYLVEIETLAQDILTLKETKLELANTLNKLQESLRALQKCLDKRSFLKLGLIFVQYPTELCIKIVQDEIESAKAEYESITLSIREKLLKKRDLEYEPQIKGIGLKPLSNKEAEAVVKAFSFK